MKFIRLMPFLLLLLFAKCRKEEKLQVINADSTLVDVREGDTLKKQAWRISPQISPDYYIVNKPNTKVTFYTNKDSISFVVEPGKEYKFIILLKGKQKALTEIIYQPSYLEILKKAGLYNNNENRKLPEFTYENKDDMPLVNLRKKYNLDSIAGDGDELSKILNLMHWMHNTVRHDGQHRLPSQLNADSMLTTCRIQNRGLNCRGLAIALNECYLAIGIKSRYVTCLPKDSLNIDQDCHVIDAVYSDDLKKWIWIDPTFDTYVTDENGNYLGIEEVRERLINDKPLEINPDANWNHKQKETKDMYLYQYMAKNLYMLECPVHSTYNYETVEPDKKIEFVKLIPVEYFKQKPIKEIEFLKKNARIIKYKTNNEGKFWSAPNEI